mgnify:CR=1 FL=1
MSNTKESVVLKYDDMGIPSIMLKVENTAKTPEEADRMFFVRGVEYDAVYLSRFVNCVQNGRAYSLPLMYLSTWTTRSRLVERRAPAGT